MSSFSLLNPPLSAKNGHQLCCVIVARISTKHQDALSLDDQIAKCRAFLDEHFDDKVRIEVISSRGSGEYLDTEELHKLENIIESRQFDLVLVEDLSRICRRRRAYFL